MQDLKGTEAFRRWIWLSICLVLWIWTPESVTNAQETPRCPPRCLCFRTTVRCMFLQLEKIPPVPVETTILDLRFNRIRDIAPDALADLKNLNTLLLNNNHIVKLQNGVFNGLQDLRYLYLYKNRIREIEKDVFQGLPKLEQLYLHFNQLEDIDPETFSNAPSLERLFLHNNKLQRIPGGAFRNMEALRRLRLDSNALICDCQMLWLARMLNEKQGTTQAAATCEYPAKLHGKPVSAIVDDFNCKKPFLTEEPTDVEISFGGTVYFTCKAEGDPEPDIIWLYNNNEISTENDPRYQVLQDGTLMIENASDSDMGSYECMAKSPAGEVKSRQVKMKPSAHIRVKPRFVQTPEDVDVLDGQTGHLKCDVIGNPRPEVTWTFNDKPVDRQRSEVTADGELVLSAVNQDDAGTYRCTASNTLGKITAAAQVRVLTTPVLVERPTDQSAYEDDAVEFACSTDGYPSPFITWLKGGTPLVPDARTAIGQTRMRIEQVKSSDQGRYTCRATNNVGTVEADASLVVLPAARTPAPVARRAPFFTRTPESLETVSGTTIEFNCQAEGFPVPTILWRKDGQSMRDSFHATIDGGNLKLRNVSKADEGTYECTALNDMGVIVARARMTVRETFASRRTISNRVVVSAVEEARRAVDRAVNDTIAQLFSRDRNTRLTHAELIRLNRFPNAAAREVARAAEVYERALSVVRRTIESGMQFNLSNEFSYNEVLNPQQLQLIANMSGCLTHRRIPDCSDMCFHSKYRTMDGSCNNMKNPLWGSSFIAFKRLLPPVYENGFNLPIGWSRSVKYNGFTKPSARLVSTRIVSTKEVTGDPLFTHMLMQWGQFLDHDLDHSVPGMAAESFGEHVDCLTSCDYSAPCFPIEIPPNDPRVRAHRCMEFIRDSAICGSGATSVLFNNILPREQINQLTSFIDASQIYASADREARELRDIFANNGHLRVGVLHNGGRPMLPFATENTPMDCQRDPNESDIGCFLAGDLRANEQTGLLAMHTIWFREHNRMADELRRYNPHWDGDVLYHEARKIMGAVMQHITYSHWLPHIIGPKGMNMMGEYKGYDPQVDASISNVFATAALRMGHGLVQPVLHRLNASFLPIPEGPLLLQDAFFSPWRLLEEGGVDPILRGLFATPAKVRLSDQLLNNNLTENLFRPAHVIALDLAALNIQRGRDHGLPSYNEWRRFCGFAVAETFDDLKHEIRSHSLREKLQQLYGHPSNIDAWVGGMAEDLVDEAKIGPTFRCLLVDQFRRLRDGDRFWYENPGVFKPEQLTQIKQSSLGRVICDNSDGIREVTNDVFRLPKLQSPPYVSCSKVPSVDLRFWTECCNDCRNSGQFNSITRRGRRSLVDQSPAEDDSRRFSSLERDTSSYFRNNSIPEFPLPQEPDRVTSVVLDNNTVPDVKTSLEVETQDERIEGLETMMAKLQRTLKKMVRKIRRLENLCQSKLDDENFVTAVTKRKKINPKTNCVDSNSVTRTSGETWDLDKCTECNCKSGFIRCTTLQCPVCENPRVVEGECCPLCDVE